MIDLINRVLPNTVIVGGRPFSIYTDFRKWIQFCNEYELWKSDKSQVLDFSYLFKNVVPAFYREEDMNGILYFAYPQNILPRVESSEFRVLDYIIDSDYIYSAFLQQYGIDLIDIEELHWHKFKALLNGLSDATKLSEIMGYRCYEESHAKNEKELYQKLKSAWELPQIETEEEKEAEDKFNELFG